jgi:hypothetical protein
MMRVLLFLLGLGSSLVVSAVDAYSGADGPVSARYAVEIVADSVVHRPHVYEVSGDSFGGTIAQGRTVSFLDIGMEGQEEATITVRASGGAVFPNGTEIRPLSYGFKGEVLEGGLAFRFKLKGTRKWVSLHAPPGTPTSDGYVPLARHAFLLFVSSPIPDPGIGGNVLRFGPGEHRIGDDPAGRGTLVLPDVINTVVLERGAWVEGKIVLPRHRPSRLLGCGVLSGAGFSHGARHTNGEDGAALIQAEITYQKEADAPSRPSLFINGPTVVQASRHNVEVGVGGWAEQVKVIGWAGNNDGFRMRSRAVVRDCFVKTGDDAFRFLGSAIRTSRCVVWQHSQGGCFVSGWGRPADAQSDCVAENCDVVAAEWTYHKPGPGSRAVVSVWRNGEQSQIRDFLFRDIRVDGDAFRALSIGFCEEGRGSIEDIRIENLSIRGQVSSSNVIAAAGSRRSVRKVTLAGFSINGKLALDPQAARLESGENVAAVTIKP